MYNMQTNWTISVKPLKMEVLQMLMNKTIANAKRCDFHIQWLHCIITLVLKETIFRENPSHQTKLWTSNPHWNKTNGLKELHKFMYHEKIRYASPFLIPIVSARSFAHNCTMAIIHWECSRIIWIRFETSKAKRRN